MELKDLTLFIKVVDAGSFTAAGELLGMPKSTVSRHITQLERELGVRLLRRTTRRISLTEAGRACYSHCLRINAETDDFVDLLRAEDSEPSGRIRLAMPIEFAASSFASTLFKFYSRYPLIDLDLILDVRQGAGIRHLDLLKENVDLAVVIGDPGVQSLIARNIGFSRLELFANPGYLDQHGWPSDPDELGRYKLLYMPEGVDTPYWKLFNGNSSDPRLSSGLRSNNVLMLKEAARAGLGIGTLPEWICELELKNGELVKVLDGCIAGEADFYLIYPDRYLPKRTRLMVNYLLDPETPVPWYRQRPASGQ